MDPARLLMYFGIALAGAAGVFYAKSKLSPRKTIVITVLMGLTGITILVLFPFYLNPRFSPAYDVSKIVFYQGSRGNTLLVYNSGDASDRESSLRLSVLNVETGEILGKEILGFTFGSDDDNTRLLGITDDEIWLDDYDNGVHARDPYSGKLIMSEEEILTRFPHLKTSTKKAMAKTNEGLVFQVEPPDFDLKITTFPKISPQYKDTTRFPFKVEYDNEDVNAVVGDQVVMLLVNRDKSDREVMQVMKRVNPEDTRLDVCINESLKLRQAFLINNGGTLKDTYIKNMKNNSGFSNPKSLLIGHHEYTEGRTTKLLLSRVDMKGNVLWDITEATLGSEPKLYYTHGGILYMTVGGKVMAFDQDTGVKKWEREL